MAFNFGCFALVFIAPTLLNNTSADWVHLLKSFFFVPFDKNGSGLFPVLFVGWTLNYEMFFYGVFWIAMVINHKHRELIASALLISVFVIANIFPQESIVAKFYGHTILFEFIFGMLFRLLWTRLQDKPAQTFYTLSVISGAFLCASLAAAALYNPLFLTDSGEFIGKFERGFVWGIPSALFCITVMCLFVNKAIPALWVLLGDASYSLYLIHAYPIQGMDKLFGVFNHGILISVIASIGAAVFVIALSVIFYKLIERPLTKFLRNKALS